MRSEQEEVENYLPERGLLTGVLRRAIWDYLGSDGSESRDAEYWIFKHSGNRLRLEFSFTWICEHLNLDPQQVRASIKYHKENPQEGQESAFAM